MLAVRERPRADRAQRGGQRGAQRGERVVDARRHLGVHLAADQAVALHAAQRLGQHLLRDRRQVAEELVVAAGAVAEREQHVDGPLGGQEAQAVADEAGVAGAIRAFRSVLGG